MAKHPEDLLTANTHKLEAWLSDQDAEHPSIALGAIGEMVAAKALDGEIVSDRTHGHDVVRDDLRIEVKVRLVETRWTASLGRKDATHVARVILKRHAVPGRADELWAETVELRERFPSSSDPWTPVSGFKRLRVA